MMNNIFDRFVTYATPEESPARPSSRLPIVVFVGMVTALVLLDAVLPLKYLQFRDALLLRSAPWLVLPTLHLFPGWALSIFVPGLPMLHVPSHSLMLAWRETGLLFGAFLLLFLVYLMALCYLPRYISPRFIFLATFLLGLFCVCMPIVTSSDIFSYIAYARLWVIYHLNPLTALPIWMRHDPIYSHVDWIEQPSAYGPTWAIIVCLLQFLLGARSSAGIVPLVLSLRLFGLAMHLGSTVLIWSISGYLMGIRATFLHQRRLFLTLAFAWNSLLLFESCVNAHNDITVLFFVLLMLWLLARGKALSTPTVMLAAIAFALATCLKINIVLLLPGLLLFLLMQPRRWRKLLGASVAYVGTVALLYSPFWQNGAALHVFRVNPATYRVSNSLAEFATHLYNGLSFAARVSACARDWFACRRLYPCAESCRLCRALCSTLLQDNASRAAPEDAACFDLLARAGMAALWCGWLTLVLALVFRDLFGLSALVDATASAERRADGFLRVSPFTLLLAFSMLSLYVFSVWPMSHSNVPGLMAFHWSYFRGLWIWLLPLLALPFLL